MLQGAYKRLCHHLLPAHDNASSASVCRATHDAPPHTQHCSAEFLANAAQAISSRVLPIMKNTSDRVRALTHTQHSGGGE